MQIMNQTIMKYPDYRRRFLHHIGLISAPFSTLLSFSLTVRALSSWLQVRVNSIGPTYGVTHSTLMLFRYVELK